MRSLAEWAQFGLRNGFSPTELDGLEYPAMLGLISFKQNFVV